MKKVLCISEVCCDILFGGLPKLPGPGEEVFGNYFALRAGGGSNTASLLALEGVPTAYLTAIGDDLCGRIIQEELEENGVELKRLPVPDYQTPVSAVLSTPGERSFATCAFHNSLPLSGEILEAAVKEADIVHTFFGYALHSALPALCEKHGVLFSLDASFADSCRPESLTLLPHSDYVKLNEAEALRLSGKKTAEEALDFLAEKVRKAAVITLGKDGALGKERGKETLFQPAVDAGPFVDACGAGDAFAAGFISAAAEGESFREGLRRGAELAGKCVTWYGGSPRKSPENTRL